MNQIASAALVLGLLLTACGGEKSSTASSEDAAATTESPAADAKTEAEAEAPADVATLSPDEEKTAVVRVGKVENRVLSGGLKVNGVLDAPPENEVAVSAPFGGIVERTTLLQGARVRAGQVLAEIRNPEFVQLQQQYLEASSQLQFAKAEFERQQELYRQEVAPQKNFQRARAEYQGLQAQVASQAARLRLANLPVGGALVTTAPVTAPRGGYLKTVNVSAGQSITPTDVLFQIVDPAHLDVVLTVFEKDVPALRVGQPVRYTLANDSAGAEHQASIYLIGRAVTEDRTVRVYAHLRREDPNRLPGTYVRAVVETRSATVPAVPEKAVVQFSGRSYVFVAQGKAEKAGENAYRMVPVATGITEDGYTQITLPAGMAPATTPIVTSGAYALLAKLKNAAEEEE